MGAHPKAPSLICPDGGEQALDAWLKEHPEALGQAGELPFLMKILAADTPLSIQAHPNQQQARAGFARENALGIPIDHPKRNYKDANHKPELICALNPFTALCGFRPHAQITAGLRLSGLDSLLPEAGSYVQSPTSGLWKACFEAILRLSASDLAKAIERVVNEPGKALETWMDAALTMVSQLSELYPGDAGALAPLYLNLVELQAGQALYLDAGIPHAYLKGAGIEVMASSDNVLRGGLTPKHVNIDELLRVISFDPLDLKILDAVKEDSGLAWYATPAQEFRLGVADLKHGDSMDAALSGPAIALCYEGTLGLHVCESGLELSKGEAAFLDAATIDLRLSGHGRLYICATPSH